MRTSSPEFIAHRGASHDAPENTVAAFSLGWEQEADGFETDLRLTRDRKIVCMHDSTTGRTAPVNRVVAESTLAQLRELDVGAWKETRWAGQRIPTIDDALAMVRPGKKIFMEIKCEPDILVPLMQVVVQSRLRPEQMTITSFSQEVVAEAKRQFPEIKALWITGYQRDEASGRWTPSLAGILETLQGVRADGVESYAHASIDDSFVRALRKAGMEFHVWTVDAPATAVRFRALGVVSIATNRPGWLRRQVTNLTKS